MHKFKSCEWNEPRQRDYVLERQKGRSQNPGEHRYLRDWKEKRP